MPADEWATCQLPDMIGTPPHEVRLDEDQGGNPYPCRICPGYLVRTQQSIEGGRACMALKSSSLHLFYPRLECTILDAAEVMMAAWNLWEAAEAARLERERGNG